MPTKYYRSKSDRVIWGICGGLGESLGVDAVIIRIVMVILAVAGGPGLLAYILLRFIMPEQPSAVTPRRDVSKRAIAGQWNVIDVTETNRSVESIGREPRFIDNSRSAAPIQRSFILSREWTQRFVVEEEKTRTVSSSAGLGISLLGDIKATVENEVASRFSISGETRRQYTEEVSIDVPAGVRLRLDFHWKRIWQHGFVRMRDAANTEIEVPFKIAVGLTFDQVHVDE